MINGPSFVRGALQEAGFPQIAELVDGGLFARIHWERLRRVPTLAEVRAAGCAFDLCHLAGGRKPRDGFTVEQWHAQIVRFFEAYPDGRAPWRSHDPR